MQRFDSNVSSFVQFFLPRKEHSSCAGVCRRLAHELVSNVPRPIPLKCGDEIATLAGALSLMQSLPDPDRYCALWRDAGELLVEAAIDARWLPDAEAQLSQVLREENLL